MKLPNGFGSVSKLSGNRRKPYVVRKAGKIIGYVTSREEGITMLSKFNESPWDLDEKKATFSDVYNLWNTHKRSTINEHTAKNYDSKYRTVCQPLYNVPYNEIRLSHFMEIIDGFKGSAGSKNNIRKFFRAMDKTAYEFDIIDKQYSEMIPTQSVEYAERSPFTEEEIASLWGNVDAVEDVDLVLMLIYTGFRSGEFCSLLKSNIDLENLTIKGGSKTKAGKNRIVPIHPKIKPLIEKRIKVSEKDTLLNYGDKALRVRFKKAMKALGMDHIPHECRHTLRTRLDDAGANQKCIDLILGHASSGSEGMRTYTHKTLDQLKETILLIN